MFKLYLFMNFSFIYIQRYCYRSSQRRCVIRKGFLKIFSKLTGKHLCKSLIFNKNFIKKETLAQVFSCIFCEFSKNTFFFVKHLRTTASVSNVLVFIQMNCPWQSFGFSLALAYFQFSFILSCWCSIKHVKIFISNS